MLGFMVRLGLEFRVRLWPGYIYRQYIHDLPHVPPHSIKLYKTLPKIRKPISCGISFFRYCAVTLMFNPKLIVLSFS